MSKKATSSRASTGGDKRSAGSKSKRSAAATSSTRKASSAKKSSVKATTAKSAGPKAAAKGKATARSAAKSAPKAAPPKAAAPAQPKQDSSKADAAARKRRRGPSVPDSPLKKRFAALQVATRQITTMKRSITKHFFDVGVLLNQIRDDRLYEVKGYGSFESFVEREIDLNKIVCLRSARIAQALDREVAQEAGLDRSAAAVAALDGEFVPGAMSSAGSSATVGPLVPLHKQ